VANLATIADAIKAEIDAAAIAGTSFNRTFEANVLWANRQIPLETTGVLRVDIAPIGHSRKLFARGVHLLEFRYHVGVRKRFEGTIPDDEVEGLSILLDGLMKFFMPRQTSKTGRPLASFQEAWVLGPGSTDKQNNSLEIEATIEWSDLEELSQFTGHFPLTIHVAESDGG